MMNMPSTNSNRKQCRPTNVQRLSLKHSIVFNLDSHSVIQARRQEMKWGCFFVKKWTFPQRRVHYVQYQYLFYILLIWGCVCTQRTPLPTGL